MKLRKPSPLLRVVPLSALLLVLVAGQASAAPTGVFESVDVNGVVSGWTLDPTLPSTPLAIHVYLDAPAGMGGVLVGSTVASSPRNDVGPHGFSYALPPRAWDGRPHAVYIYGINASGHGGTLLGGSPRMITLAPTRVRITNGTVRIAIEPRCGGTIVEFGVVGAPNLINNGDCTGRQIQTALYDGAARYDACAGCTGIWAWDPVQGGDAHNAGSPVVAQSVSPSSIYVKTRPYEWLPGLFGGGPGHPVPSDVIVEQWISFVPEHPRAVKIRVRVEHVGMEARSLAVQEIPAVYVNRGWDRLVTYAGPTPWTGDVVTSTVTSPLSGFFGNRAATERWVAFADDAGHGLTVYVPWQYPWFDGFAYGSRDALGEFSQSSNYFRPHVPYAFAPGSVFDGEFYVIAGSVAEARTTIYALRPSVHTDLLPPYGFLDAPADGSTVSGTVPVSGWTFDDTAVARVEVLVDDRVMGTATHGTLRPDVASAFPAAAADVGFQYALRTSALANGQYRLSVRAFDDAGHSAILLGSKTITVANVAPPPPAPSPTPSTASSPASAGPSSSAPSPPAPPARPCNPKSQKSCTPAVVKKQPPAASRPAAPSPPRPATPGSVCLGKGKSKC